jgi:hypothetical protein
MLEPTHTPAASACAHFPPILCAFAVAVDLQRHSADFAGLAASCNLTQPHRLHIGKLNRAVYWHLRQEGVEYLIEYGQVASLWHKTHGLCGHTFPQWVHAVSYA